MAAITLDIAGNTRQLDRDIQKTVNKVYSINLKTKGDQPLGRITGQVNEFNKSLDASNARVIAFGASAGIIFGVERAFTALVQSTIEVQKSLQDINVILNVSQQQLQKFGAGLFDIAKNTGQSFKEVATAATEFSRQGLGVEETLKRTNEALILSRLSGLDTAKSVETLTAAVNSFASQAVTATEIVNKFATVDAAFAVSSADLADAISRVGSSAAQSGVSLNELIAIVTSAQQTTARGGAVIGNSFKTIFTRLQREKVVDLLESLGISTTDSSGQLKSTIQLLTDLGKVYDTLGTQQQAYVAEQVGGVFQINILKAALADLGKEYSIYNSALNVAAGATDQAIKRNEELNKTYAAQINALQQNATQLAAAAGERLLGPSIDRLVGGTNTLLEGFSEGDGQGVGAVLGKGILDGIGQFIAGPGLALIGGVLLKLFKDLGKFATGSVQQLLGLNTAATQQRDLQQSINQILAKNPQLLQLALQGEQGLNQAANTLLASLQKQTVELQKQAQVASQISKAFVAQAGVRVSGGVPVVPTGRPGKAAGYIPNFAKDDFAREELLATALGAKNPTAQLSKGTIDGRKFIKNNREVEITGFGSNGDSAVIPSYAKGFIPNFASAKKTKEKDLNQEAVQKFINEISTQVAYLVPAITPNGARGTDGTVPAKSNFKGFIFPQYVANAPLPTLSQKTDPLEKTVTDSVIKAASDYTSQLQPLGLTASVEKIRKNFKIIPGAVGALQGAVGSAFEVGIASSLDYEAANRDKRFGDFDVRGGAGLSKVQQLFGIQGKTLADFKATTSDDSANSFREKILKEATAKAQGIKFDTSDAQPIVRSKALSELRAGLSEAELAKNFTVDKGRYRDLKTNADPALKKRLEQLIIQKRGLYPQQYPRNKAAGYIPNFAAIQDAVERERAAGIPSNQIYLAQEKALTSANPMGLGVFNKQDEPTKRSRKNAMRRKGFASGYVPNFAIADNNTNNVSKSFEDLNSKADSLGSSIAAVVTQLGFLAFGLRGAGREYKQSLKEITRSNVQSAKKITESAKKRVLEEKNLSKREPLRQEYLAAKTAEKKAARGTFGQKTTAAGGVGGFAVAFAAPIIAETVANSIGQETAGARRTSAGISAVGQIASFAGAGAMFGPWGAAIGAATGALLTIPNFIEQMFTEMPEFRAAIQKASEDVARTGEATQQYLRASAELQAAYAEQNKDPEKIKQLENQVSQALAQFKPEQRAKIEAAPTYQEADVVAKELLNADIAAQKLAESLAALQNNLELYNKEIARQDSEIAAATASGFDTGLNLGPIRTDLKPVTNAIIQSSKLGNKQGKELQEALKLSGLNLSKFEEIQLEIPENFFTQSFDTDKFRSAVLGPAYGRNEGAVAAGKILQSGDLMRSAGVLNQILPPEVVSKILSGPEELVKRRLGSLGTALISLASQTDASVEAQNKKDQAIARETILLESAKTATENIISSLEKSITATQEAADRERELIKARQQFIRNTSFADAYSRPAQTVGAIVGTEAPLAQAFSLREAVATIGKTQIEGVQGTQSEFIGNINESIRTAFSEILKTTRGQAPKEGTSDQIETSNKELQNLANTQDTAFSSIQTVFQNLLKNNTSGDIKTQEILTQITQLLTAAKVDDATLQKITEKIIVEAGKSNNEIAKLREASILEFKTLAKEQTQKILIAKIGQAQKFGGASVGGGIQEFINPKEPGQGVFDKVVESTQGFEQFQGRNADYRFDYLPGTNQYRYQYGAADRAREEMAPERGRKALFLIDQLQDFTGYTPNATGKGITAGEEGLKEFYDRQIKELENIAKSTSDPIVREEITAALKEVDTLGGTETIAKLQVAQRTGTLTEAGFKEITGKFQSPVLEALRKQAVAVGGTEGEQLLKELDAMGMEMLASQDPTVNAINKSNIILDKILSQLGGKTVQPAGITTAPIIPPTAPKTISEIEAETTRARDQRRFEEWSRAGGIGLGPTQRSAEGNYREKTASRADMVDPTLAATDAFNKSRIGLPTFNRIQAEETEIERMLDPNWKLPASSAIERAKYNPFSPITYDNAMERASEPGRRLTQTQPAAAQQSFTQQEAALNNNTSSVNNLVSAVSNLTANLNNQPNQQVGPQTQPTIQPNVTTTTTAPVTVVVQAQASNDIAIAVGSAVESAIPTIIDKVRLALGEKVPPTAPAPIKPKPQGGG